MSKKKFSVSKDGLHEIVDVVDETTMEGDTLLERTLNAYLTKQFIMPSGIPADECLKEAREIIAIVQTIGRRNR